jgi:hypothetical protein
MCPINVLLKLYNKNKKDMKNWKLELDVIMQINAMRNEQNRLIKEIDPILYQIRQIAKNKWYSKRIAEITAGNK